MKGIILFFISLFSISIFITDIYSDSYIIKRCQPQSYKEFDKCYQKVSEETLPSKNEELILNRTNYFKFKKESKIDFYTSNIPLSNSFSSLPDPYLKDQKWLTLINALDLVNLSQGEGVTIGLLDSGVEKEHEDLSGQIIQYYNVAEKNNDITDSFGHGTAVAGIIAAIANNGNGIRGIAPESKIVVAKVNKGASPTFEDISVAEAIYYLVDNGAEVINMSIQMDEVNQSVEDAIEYAKNKGVILVAATGNYGQLQESYPASNDYVLGVASVNDNLELASFSNYDSNVFILAPGENVFSTITGNNYGYKTGTSYSAPMITGLIADILSLNKSLNYNDIKKIILQNSATEIPQKSKIVDSANSIYGTGVALHTDMDSYSTGDYLNLSMLLPPMSVEFDIYFAIILPSDTLISLSYENGTFLWRSGLYPIAYNATLSDYYTVYIWGEAGSNRLFKSLEITDDFLPGTYTFCSAYKKDQNFIGYINCKEVKINE